MSVRKRKVGNGQSASGVSHQSSQEDLHEDRRSGNQRQRAQKRIFHARSVCLPAPAREDSQAHREAKEHLRQSRVPNRNQGRELQENRDAAESCLA